MQRGCLPLCEIEGWGWVEDKIETYYAYCAHAVRVNILGNILHPPPTHNCLMILVFTITKTFWRQRYEIKQYVSRKSQTQDKPKIK